jgi:predicted naringenin-chalcone synthase
VRALKLYEKFLLDKGIQRRHIAGDPKEFIEETADERVKRFEHWAVQLSADAARNVLSACACSSQDVDAVFVATCTGYLCPGLSTYMIQELGLRQDVYNADLVGLGCVGAMPALRAASHYLARHENSNVLVIAVEICTAASHWAEKPELILSNAIFSDGAAAVLLTNRPDVSGLKLVHTSSLVWPQFRDELRFSYFDGRLANVISPKVSDITVHAVEALCTQCQDNTRYAFHAGGRKVLDAIQQHRQLSDESMWPSRRILRDYGNMSSPSVLFVLKDILRQGLQHNDPVVCFSFGAGFSAAILHLQWCASIVGENKGIVVESQREFR